MGVFLLEIRQAQKGFNGFIGSWLINGALNFLVDVGPSSSAGDLTASLREMGVERIDYVLLTHIHLDHAGGLSSILKAFPDAMVIAHEKAIRHLVEPSALWEGSRKVLGPIAEQYGAPLPVARERLLPHTEAAVSGLEILETPGHAAHHLSFVCGGHLFAGEAGGNFFRWDGMEYLRPATPPPFLFEQFTASIKLLMGIRDMPICYGHFGKAESSRVMLGRFLSQVRRWREILGRLLEAQNRMAEIDFVDILLGEDPELRSFPFMDRETGRREKFFMLNSIRGFIGYLKQDMGRS